MAAAEERRLRRDAEAIMRAALKAADAGNAVRRHLALRKNQLIAGNHRLSLEDVDRIVLVSVGKAAVGMAAAVEELLGNKLSFGLVVTKHGHQPVDGPQSLKLGVCRTLTSAHPVPDEAGLAASRDLEALLRTLNARDLLLVAVSGGASALLPGPMPGLTLRQKQKTTDLLLRAGADIYQLNTVRKHLSSFKGGRLAALAYPATVVGLLLSDVIGDPPDVIGSGLTAPDPSTYDDALSVIAGFGLDSRVPPAILKHLRQGRAGKIGETPREDDPVFKHVRNVIVGSNRESLRAAASEARNRGYKSLILSSTITGEAREVARVQASILREASLYGTPAKPPVCLLSGGETTVTVRGNGKGGRNQEFALAAALALEGVRNVLALSLGTDGTDGPTDAAGALSTGTTVERSRQLGLRAGDALRDNDSYPFFDRLGDSIKTGPTGTNVMDIHVLLSR